MSAAFDIVENLEILGLVPGSTMKDIRSAFRRLALTCHPDIAGPQSEKAFERITGAYMLLRNLSPELLLNPPAPDEKRKKSRSGSPFARERGGQTRRKTSRAEGTETTANEDEHIRDLRLEKALLDAELGMARLRRHLETKEEESEIGRLTLRFTSSHPSVRLLAVTASARWIAFPLLQGALEDMLRRFSPDREMLLLVSDLSSDRDLQSRLAAAIASRAVALDEDVALLFLQWIGAIRERGDFLAKFLAHPSQRVIAGALQRWPAKHPLPDDLSLIRLLRIDDEAVLLPLLRLLRGTAARVPAWARARLRNLSENHPSQGVRVWARSIVGSPALL